MSEELTLTTPVVIPQKTTSSYRVSRLLLDAERGHFTLVVRGTQGETISAERDGPVAITLMRSLNKANLTVKSLERRALEWLATQPEGEAFSGAVSGAPD